MAVVAYKTQHISAANATVYTFSSTSTGGLTDFGATASDRVVIVGLWGQGTTNTNISSLTVGGLTADIPAQSNEAAAADNMTDGIASVLFASATSGIIVLTFGAGKSRAGISVWSATETNTASAATYGFLTFASVTTLFAQATTGSMTTVVGTSGFFVAEGGHSNTVGATFAWTNATLRHQTTMELSAVHTGADGTSSAAVTLQTAVSANFGSVWAAWDTVSTATATGGEELYRTFLPMHSAPVGRRPLMASFYEWCPV